jgi:hypothetical protein
MMYLVCPSPIVGHATSIEAFGILRGKSRIIHQAHDGLALDIDTGKIVPLLVLAAYTISTEDKL